MNHNTNKNRRAGRRAFTIIEILVVVGIMAVLSGLVVWGVTRAATARKLNRVRTELHQLETVIDAYHEAFGFYPPDNTNDPGKPPLFYELTGTTNLAYENRPETYATIRGDFPTSEMIQEFFYINGFANSNPETTRNFFPEVKGGQRGTITNIPGNPIVRFIVLAVPIPGPDDFPSYDPDNPNPVNPWRYVSTRPTNNPASYDLWADIMIGTEVRTIGNWKE